MRSSRIPCRRGFHLPFTRGGRSQRYFGPCLPRGFGCLAGLGGFGCGACFFATWWTTFGCFTTGGATDRTAAGRMAVVAAAVGVEEGEGDGGEASTLSVPSCVEAIRARAATAAAAVPSRRAGRR